MSLHITSTSKSARRSPTTRDELRSLIEQEIGRQRPDADLNHIDTSKIEDMHMLFWWIDIRNIKIDEWDVSNVTNMSCMFTGSKNFNCDLSKWYTFNVINMSHMFANCDKFNSDLSSWNVSNVLDYSSIFRDCNISDSYKPKFKVYN